IALGIGVNTGIFTILNGVGLRSLPVPGASQLVSVYQNLHGKIARNVHGEQTLVSFTEYQTYRDDNHVFSGLLAYFPFLSVTLGGDQPRQLYGQLTSCNYFDVLNEHPSLGRPFVASDCATPKSGAVVVLSHDLWRNSFGSDPAIAGKQIILNRQIFTVIGVAPEGFQGTEPVPAAFWVPLTMQPLLEPQLNALEENWSWLALLGRTKAGVSLPQVRADLSVIAARIDRLTPGRSSTLTINTATFLSIPEAHKIVMAVGAVLLAAVGMVLLIACANVANLLLARAAGRHKEIAIRLSVGASRGRLIRQLLTESMLLSILGGALGSLLALWSFQAIAQFILSHLPPGTPPIVFNVGPDLRVLAYCALLTLITGIAFGLMPALQASRPDLNTALKEEGSGLGARSTSRGFLRQSLVSVQVAVCMILLIAAGLFLRALHFAQTIDPGFEMKNIASVSYDLRGQGYTAQRAAVFNQQLVDRVASLPGVDAVAQALTTPLSDSHHGTGFTLAGETANRQVEFNSISPQYFTMLGIPIVRGRDFTAAEARAGAHVAIVTESTARRFWPGQDPIGKTLRQDQTAEFEVIGVAKDAQVSHMAETKSTYLYLPTALDDQLRLQLLFHSAAGFAATASGIRAAIHALDPGLVVDVAPLEDNLEFWRTPARIVAILAGSLGALGLLLASIGLYGVVSYSVSRRVREIGLRMTLGAETHDVMSMVLRQAMRPVIVGAVIGIAGCAAVSRVLSRMLLGISPHDPVAFLGVPVFLLAVALLASYIPARRATKVDPMVALRYE
ncbi:MAG TPA: ABC transporter permease, partial [Bryobacteraceae bacterium]|nr:ABC transporter permease [Bryobacteraceae bacterium]